MSAQNSPMTFRDVVVATVPILRTPRGEHAPILIKEPVGIGDTIHNGLDRIGLGPKLRAYSHKIKRNCGCDARRVALNRRWCYAPPRGKPFLSIAFPHFRDWEGLWASLQSVLYEAQEAGLLDRIEIVVVDQSHDTTHGEKVRGYLAGWVPVSSYVKQDNLGTAAAKMSCFQHARGEWVLLLDCHAALKPGSLKAIFQFAATHRADDNLYAGVMDLGAGYHWQREQFAEVVRRVWRKKFKPEDFRHLATEHVQNAITRMLPFATSEEQDVAAVLGTDWGFHSHVDSVWRGDSHGRWATDHRAARADAPLFEVDNAAGWFLFCNRAAWLHAYPYHPLMRGFGGEEGVMVKAFQARGAKCFVAPFARGTHRFGRAEPPQFPNDLKQRIFNYALAYHTLKLPDEMERMKTYFCWERGRARIEGTAADFENGRRPLPLDELEGIIASAVIAAEQFKNQVAEQRRAAIAAAGSQPPTQSLEELYRLAKDTPSDFNEHVPTLMELAKQCHHVTELGTRHGTSTVALLYAQPEKLVTVDLACADCHLGHLKAVAGKTALQLVQADSRTVVIEPTELLFVDTYHVADQLREELKQHADKVSRYIALHDTVTFGEIGEHGNPGLLVALREWMTENPHWKIIRDDQNNNGLIVLERIA